MANRHKTQKFNVGGAALVSGNPKVVAAAKDSKNKPGAIQKKDGGKVVGKASGGRLDKRARGGSPFSAAAKVKG